MNIYIVMAGQHYYPTGPGDIKGAFTSESKALEFRDKLEDERDKYDMGDLKYDWVRVVTQYVQRESE